MLVMVSTSALVIVGKVGSILAILTMAKVTMLLGLLGSSWLLG